LFGLDASVDPCIVQCRQVSLRVGLGQVALERDGAAGEEFFDCFNIAFE